jgi:hypothetical protein
VTIRSPRHHRTWQVGQRFDRSSNQDLDGVRTGVGIGEVAHGQVALDLLGCEVVRHDELPAGSERMGAVPPARPASLGALVSYRLRQVRSRAAAGGPGGR